VGRERLQGKGRLWLESLKYFVVSFLTSLSVCLSGLCACVPVCLWSLPLLVWLGLGWVGTYGSGGGLSGLSGLIWSA
jgi:hypothetical protein